MSNPVCAYWFGHADADGVVRLRFGDDRIVRVGEMLEVTGVPVMCEHGLHASRRVIDALRYGHGPILACVRLSGRIKEGDDKIVATARETVWLGDVSATLHRFACDVAERALLAERAAGREPNPHSWAAITVKKRWLNSEANDAELSEARAAALYIAELLAREISWRSELKAIVRCGEESAAWAARAAGEIAVQKAVVAAIGAIWASIQNAWWRNGNDKKKEELEQTLSKVLKKSGVPLW